ncbi:amidase domain-containing protein [Clostridium sp. JNZ J1-5]
MLKLKKFICGLLIGSTTLTFNLLGSSSIASAVQTNNLSKNPYVQAYLNEKISKLESTDSLDKSKEYLVDPEVEEKIIIAGLEEYYNEDMKVAKILKNYIKNDELDKNTLATEADGKIATMKNIIEIYSNVKDKEDQETLKGYLKRYARNSKDPASISFLNSITPQVKVNINDKEEKEKNGIVSEDSINTATLNAASYTGTYNGSGAADWAYNNYNSYNSGFPAFDLWQSDCANFVSQAMYLGGGMPMQENWYCYKKNSTYLHPLSSDQLNYSWTLTDPSPWISAVQFTSFWDTRGSVLQYTTSDYAANHSTIYNKTIYRGDAVVFRKAVVGSIITMPTHIMIISQYDSVNKDFLLAGHSTIRQKYPALSAISGYVNIEFIHF